ncbi:hypothetical protein DPMN_105121 [Dreissena polymorpha]|uniref:Uncharacterized protein n=1 Tax=Dreissena polymorpha TaxID=45954 RepID=A0A9D4H8Y9_DREPO|nr:hypothetical protein DPMN_105121 [Dreissena polymorpha]
MIISEENQYHPFTIFPTITGSFLGDQGSDTAGKACYEMTMVDNNRECNNMGFSVDLIDKRDKPVLANFVVPANSYISFAFFQ